MGMNRLLLVMFLLILSCSDARARSDGGYMRADKNISDKESISINMDFLGLMNLLKENLPLSRQKIINAGFVPKWAYITMGFKFMECKPLKLNDGVILYAIELREEEVDAPGAEAFFYFSTTGKEILRDEVNAKLGEEKLITIGMVHSVDEEYEYKINVSSFACIITGYPPLDQEVLSGLSFIYTEEPSETSDWFSQ